VADLSDILLLGEGFSEECHSGSLSFQRTRPQKRGGSTLSTKRCDLRILKSGEFQHDTIPDYSWS
jgi:hypothetical protein